MILPLNNTKIGWPWDESVSKSLYEKAIDWPKISIVIPSYNQGNFIEETIRSIVLQHYPNLELIVYDGQSTDNTVDVLQYYDEYITHWSSEKDDGQSDAINKGIKKSTGEIFNWLNSDDFLAKDALYHIAKAFIEIDVDCAIGDCRHFNNSDYSTIVVSHTQISENTEKTIWRLGMGQPSTYYRTSFVKEMNGLNVQLHYAMDTNLWYHFLLHKGIEKVTYIPKIISHFRLHNQSKTTAEESHFIKDVNAIRYTLLKACDCPNIVLNHFSNPINDSYQSNWYLAKIDKEKLVGYFAHYVGTEFYTAFKYTEALQCFKIALAAGIKTESTVKQYYKLKFIPKFILNLLRKI